MEKAHPLGTPMEVRSLDVKKDPFRPKFSATPTQRHWKGVKHIFHYFRGTTKFSATPTL